MRRAGGSRRGLSSPVVAPARDDVGVRPAFGAPGEPHPADGVTNRPVSAGPAAARRCLRGQQEVRGRRRGDARLESDFLGRRLPPLLVTLVTGPRHRLARRPLAPPDGPPLGLRRVPDRRSPTPGQHPRAAPELRHRADRRTPGPGLRQHRAVPGRSLRHGRDLEPSRPGAAELPRAPRWRHRLPRRARRARRGPDPSTFLASFGTFGRHNIWLGLVGELPAVLVNVG